MAEHPDPVVPISLPSRGEQPMTEVPGRWPSLHLAKALDGERRPAPCCAAWRP